MSGAVYIWLALLLVLLPLDWLLSAFLAAAIHEVCHILVLFLLGGKLEKFEISPTGCVLEAFDTGFWQSICSILAGPAGSLLLLLLSHNAPKIAICGMVHGLYNLMPLLPLDGGRILQLLLYRFLPAKAEEILLQTGRIFCVIMLFSCVCVSIVHRLGVFPVILAVIWFLRWFPRKIPCKPSQIKVQ